MTIYIGIGHGEIIKNSENSINKFFSEVYSLTRKTNAFGQNFTWESQEDLIKELQVKGENLIHIALNFSEAIYKDENKEQLAKIKNFLRTLQKLENFTFEFSTPQTNNSPETISQFFNSENETLINPDQLLVTCPSRVGAYACYLGSENNSMAKILKLSHKLAEGFNNMKDFQANGWNLCCMPALIWDVLSKESAQNNPEQIVQFLNDDSGAKFVEELKADFSSVCSDEKYPQKISQVIDCSIDFLTKNTEKNLEQIVGTVATKGGATAQMLDNFNADWQKSDKSEKLGLFAAKSIGNWSGFIGS
jgi:hypothetical protein